MGDDYETATKLIFMIFKIFLIKYFVILHKEVLKTKMELFIQY